MHQTDDSKEVGRIGCTSKTLFSQSSCSSWSQYYREVGQHSDSDE